MKEFLSIPLVAKQGILIRLHRTTFFFISTNHWVDVQLAGWLISYGGGGAGNSTSGGETKIIEYKENLSAAQQEKSLAAIKMVHAFKHKVAIFNKIASTSLLRGRKSMQTYLHKNFLGNL